MNVLYSTSFWILVALGVTCFVFILVGAPWMVWAAGFFLFCLLAASVITIVGLPYGRGVGFVAFAVCLVLSALLWLMHGAASV